MSDIDNPRFTALEFFAGIGLARVGIESVGGSVVWANDLDEKKASMYRRHFCAKSDHLLVEDIHRVDSSLVPNADIAWISSPCTDLSLAGKMAGIQAKRSGALLGALRVIDEMDRRAPSCLIVENVHGMAKVNRGRDMKRIISILNEMGYSVDLLSIDAALFLPHSRPRLFIVAVEKDRSTKGTGHEFTSSVLRPEFLSQFYHDESLEMHISASDDLPLGPDLSFSDVAEHLPRDDKRWWDEKRTTAFLGSLSTKHAELIDGYASAESEDPVFRTAYRRTRNGKPLWEIRSDNMAGCLRTASGGSSKQAVLHVKDGEVRVRWMTKTECARLMGAESFTLGDSSSTQVLNGFGDAVAVPVVRWLLTSYDMNF